MSTQQNNAVVIARKEYLAVVNNEKLKQQMAASLTDSDPAAVRRIVAFMANAAMKTPQLYRCEAQSIMKVMLDCCTLGIEPNGRDAHVIPYGSTATLIVDYKGMITLALKSERISSIRAEVVCENDDFEWHNGKVEHRINWKKSRGEMCAVYAIATFKDGTDICSVLTKDEVDSVRRRSRSGNGGPWVTDYNEMAKKGLALDTPIPTPGGWKTMGELNQGDYVFDKDGNVSAITSVSEVKHIDCFKVTFSNGTSVVCDNEHRWVARIGGNTHSFETYTVNDLLNAKSDGKSVTIPVQGALQLPETALPVDPYLLGYWLGDGSKNRANITCSKDDLTHVLEKIKKAGYRIGSIRTDDLRNRDCNTATIGITGGMICGLKELGVLSEKSIPDAYLRASINQRRELLAGLVDSDGHCDKERGRAIFTSTNKALAEQVFELLCSLGETPYFYEYVARGFGIETIAYNVGWKPCFNPFHLKRKAERYQDRKITPYFAIKSIERIESVPTRCISVDSPTRTYLCGKGMAVTHNTVVRRLSKFLPLSPAAAAVVAYDDADYDDSRVMPVSTAAPKANADELAAALSGGASVVDAEPTDAEQPDGPNPKKEIRKSDDLGLDVKEPYRDPNE